MDEVHEKYAAVAKDPQVKKWLDTPEGHAGVKPKLGPSRAFLLDEKMLQRLERPVGSGRARHGDSDEGRPEGSPVEGEAPGQHGGQHEPVLSTAAGWSESSWPAIRSTGMRSADHDGARLRWATGCFVAMAVVAGAGSVTCAADAPRDLLKGRGLKRVGSTYVLASEGEVQKKITELRALRNQLILAAQRQANSELQAEDEKGMMREMLRQRVLLNEQITAFDQQIRSFGGAAPELIAQRNEVVSAYNGLGDRIRLLQSGPGADPKVQDRLLAELSRRREGYIQAVLDLRQLADAATKSYAELADDAAVKEALESLGLNSRSKPKLGPSAQFTANLKLLERIEQSVMSDAVDLRKEGGVFWVNATFNGKLTRPMVFDTGASLTMIPAGLAEEIGLKPSPADPVVRCETADGTVVEARRMTIPSMRVGRFTVNAVECAVMPAGKGKVAPLLGQSFHRHFTYKFTSESGHLVMSRVEGLETAPTAQRPVRGTAKSRSRAGRSRAATSKTAGNGGLDGDRPN